MTTKIEDTKTEIRKDILERELNVGDIVVFNPPRYKGIIFGKVIKFTTKGIRVQYSTNYGSINNTALAGKDVVKVEGPELTVYLLKNVGLTK